MSNPGPRRLELDKQDTVVTVLTQNPQTKQVLGPLMTRFWGVVLNDQAYQAKTALSWSVRQGRVVAVTAVT